jgi:23S rRNA (adenine2503-C2)-methyltransferase
MVCKEISTDGSVKYLFRLQDGKNIESVLIPEKDHYTLCISSQVGCAQGCRFCLTGQAGFGRNLTSGEIIAQIRDIQYEITKNRKPCKPLTNIVFMGMGEPLANYRNVLAAIDIITDEQIGLRFSTRRVTLSTAGLVPRLYDLSRDTQVNLAVSLNAVDNETRSRLMPINKTYPLESLISACRNYPVQPRRRITFEYVLLKGLNDSPEDAKRLAELLRPIRAKINLIPFNEYAGSEFRRPDEPAVEIFRDILIKRNYTAIVRHSKGRDISAACGQLSAGGKAGVISSNAVHPPAGFPGRL